MSIVTTLEVEMENVTVLGYSLYKQQYTQISEGWLLLFTDSVSLI